MFDKIMHNEALYKIMCHDCSENNAAVDFDNSLLINGFLNPEKVLILKPDNYYNAQCIEKRPPSPDCLILINCIEKEHYDLYLIELKDVKNTRELKYEIIVEKFNTMINQFFPEFENIFSLANYKIIAFYLVTTYPKNSGQLSDTEYHRRIASSALDAYGSRKPLKLFNKAIPIQPKPSPLTIISC
jgi:hypothetical protein